MKQAQRFELVDRVARAIRGRFKSYEIASYFRSFGIKASDENTAGSSKWAYAKSVLLSEPVEMVLRIADDLDLNASAFATGASLPPKNCAEPVGFRLLISHISADKDKATRLRDCLTPYGVAAFVAHEDIHPTKEWEQELLRALHCMDALLAMHTRGFSASSWTQQEVGAAVIRGVKIISFKMGEDPTGFLARRQALPRNKRTAEEIAKEIVQLLRDDPLTRERMEEARRLHNFLHDEVPF